MNQIGKMPGFNDVSSLIEIPVEPLGDPITVTGKHFAKLNLEPEELHELLVKEFEAVKWTVAVVKVAYTASQLWIEEHAVLLRRRLLGASQHLLEVADFVEEQGGALNDSVNLVDCYALVSEIGEILGMSVQQLQAQSVA